MIFSFTGQSHDMLYERNNYRSNPEEAMQKETLFYTKHFQREQTESLKIVKRNVKKEKDSPGYQLSYHDRAKIANHQDVESEFLQSV